MKFLYDFLPVLLFFVAYKLYDIYVATVVIIAASACQVGWSWFRHRRIERLPAITLALLVLLGGATLLLHDEMFLKWKPTVVNGLFAIIFFASQWIGDKTIVERILGHAMELPGAVWVRLNLAWTVFFIVMGIANLVVAFNFDTDTWVDFKLFGMLGLTLLFVLAQGFYLARYLNTDTKPQE